MLNLTRIHRGIAHESQFQGPGLEPFDDKPFETVERLADLSALGALEQRYRSSRQPLCNNPFMSLIVEAKAKGRTLMVSP